MKWETNLISTRCPDRICSWHFNIEKAVFNSRIPPCMKGQPFCANPSGSQLPCTHIQCSVIVVRGIDLCSTLREL